MKCLSYSLRQEIYKMSVVHLIRPESEEAIKDDLRSCEKDSVVKGFLFAKEGTIWALTMIMDC